ncbi:microsomal signal peptidase 25 kDa subunit-domain-containing protein [Pseudomassariella vexata]|uniref:Signal peptidase complex subunit 2 n=1 Tax=Pseudomassariella vexata TaxID=1141098 RepID=A0A1Y2DSI1_9PEZI|nr:microsomal signal peptidase 25 kDa subunit-domain-containing protein [Pseudomassariella vexata]ORY62241.1 microsomal signal peptidase 25 kDa subunit-domain-containing protein [Pseudomassariella vexata]
MASQEKITVHNLADLKNTSDDAIPNYLNSLKFKQVHTLLDTRLALGYGAFAVAAACFGWDYQIGFESTKYYTAAAVAVYALLNTVLTYWISFVEKGTVYQGVGPDGEKISIATSTKKNVPIYNVKITVKSKAGKQSTIDIAKSFTEWFDSAGHFIAPPFQTVLASSVPMIAKADPKRAAKSESGSDFADLDPGLLDQLAAGSGSTTGAEAGSGKKSKRRKA